MKEIDISTEQIEEEYQVGQKIKARWYNGGSAISFVMKRATITSIGDGGYYHCRVVFDRDDFDSAIHSGIYSGERSRNLNEIEPLPTKE